MARYTCMIQEGQIPEQTQQALAEGLRRIGREMFGDAPEAEVAWLTIRRGFGFSAGKPSTSSIVARLVPPGLGEDVRREFMTRVCDLWMDATGCTALEVVINASDAPAAR